MWDGGWFYLRLTATELVDCCRRESGISGQQFANAYRNMNILSVLSSQNDISQHVNVMATTDGIAFS